MFVQKEHCEFKNCVSSIVSAYPAKPNSEKTAKAEINMFRRCTCEKETHRKILNTVGFVMLSLSTDTSSIKPSDLFLII